jgi:hypothetical protein
MEKLIIFISGNMQGGLFMFVASLKFSTLKVAAVLLALGIIAAAAVWSRSQIAVQTDVSTKYTSVASNEKRVQFLESYGWKVNAEPVEVVEVLIPQSFNATYKNYNVIQKKQGFDLTRFSGKRVKRWTYRITNYPGVTDEVRANLLIYNDTVIGGDVSTVALNGFMQGLSQQKDSGTVSQATSQSADITSEIFTATAAK